MDDNDLRDVLLARAGMIMEDLAPRLLRPAEVLEDMRLFYNMLPLGR